MELTILMPCLNEAETIAVCVDKAQAFLQRTGIDGEVLVSDNGSVDGSQDLARAHGAVVVMASERGYGAALMNGIKHAKGRYIIMGDADDSYNFSDLMPFVEKLRQGHELVMGNRFKGGIHPGAMPFLNRYLGNPVLSFIGKLFFKGSINDFHCGLRGFDRKAIEKIGLTSPGMEFASEMVIKSILNGLRITEVPTTLAPDGRSRPPHLRKWRDGWRHLRLLLLFSPRWMFFYPGAFMMLLGGGLMSVLSFGPIYLGTWRLDIHSLLFASTFLVIGWQAVCFALVGRVIAGEALNLLTIGKFEAFLNLFTLERGIILGALLVLVGSIGSILAVSRWAETDFGTLSPETMMRLAIPSVSLLITGMQTIFASFFLSLVLSFRRLSDSRR